MKVKCNSIREDNSLCAYCVHSKPHNVICDHYHGESVYCSKDGECGIHEITCKCEEVVE